MSGALRQAALLLAALVLFTLPAGAQEFPALTGRVVDAALLLDAPTKARLEEKLAALERQSSDQVVVATVPDLQGYDIADYGYRLGRAWGIGQRGEDNGVILLVSRDDRKVRIEVGYGLEGTLTDALSRLVIENDILPRFRDGDYPGGIEAGTDAVLQILSGNGSQVRARAERSGAWQNQNESPLTLPIVLFILLVAFGPFLAALLARLFGRRPPPSAGRRRMRRTGWGPGFGTGMGAGSAWGSGRSGGFGGGGGFSGGGGSFGGGGSSGSW